MAQELPIYTIDANYITNLDELPSPADKAAELESALTRELVEDEGSFAYRQLGERLKQIKERKDASDEAAEQRLRELQGIADEVVRTQAEPERLNLTEQYEYELFCVLRTHSKSDNEEYIADCARQMINHLKNHRLLTAGWSVSKGGRMRVEQSLLAESWGLPYIALGFDPDDAAPPFLANAMEELVKVEQQG